MASTDIDALIDGVIVREGDYSNHPADRGGETRWGITIAVARANGYTGAMRTLPRMTAVAIYRRLFWQRPGLDRVDARFSLVAELLFDIAVNMGPAVAVTFLQRSLNAFNNGGADYADVLLDGRIGPATLASLDGYKRRRGVAGEDVLVEAITALRGERFIALSESRPANEAFTFGWISRAGELVRKLLGRKP